MSKQGFEKFIHKSQSGAKKKEAIRQEKRKVKAELREKGEEHRKKKQLETRQTHNYQVTVNKKLFPAQDQNIANDRAEKGVTQNVKGKERSIQKTHTTLKHSQTVNDAQLNTKALPSEEMPLNKFIAYAGICGRREAAELVKDGKVTVNGDKVYEPGYKVTSKDAITVKEKPIFLQKNLVYILLNKPKDYITTAKDPQGRKTVLDLIKGATQERAYPVGRLDRNTTGVLLLTNDGELAQKLTHPSFQVKKIYEVKLDKPLIKKDFDAIVNGIVLNDGPIAADSLAYADTKDKSVIGIEIHSGKNRIVRRIFEHLGYDVKNLDRVTFANLTKKNVERGKWRFLREKEVRLLKYMNQSFVKKKASQADAKA